MGDGPQNGRSPLQSIAAIAAVAIVAYAIANVAHEGSHGVACILVGGRPVAISAVYFDCDETGVAPGVLKWIPASGTLVNLVLAGAALLVLRSLKRTASTERYFWWLLVTVNALQASGYWLFSGVANIGDWARVIDGLGPHWLWRVGLGAIGAVAYLAVIRFSLEELGAFLAPGPGLVQQARRLTLVPYLAGGALYVTAGLLNPLSLGLVLISAAAASFGGTSAMAWMFTLADLPRWSSAEAVEPFSPALSRAWMAGALISAVGFIAVLGPSVTF